MNELSLEIRAERAAKRSNKKIAARYPLLADQFAVSVESQLERLQKQDTDNVAYFERLQVGNQQAWERAIVRKEIARQFLPPEKFADYERRYDRIYGKYLYRDTGHFAADWWWCALRDNDVPWAWEHCPNEGLHELDWRRREGRCPTCHKQLAAPEKKSAGPEQPSLFN